jgi:glucose dehydrogenase
MSCSDVHHSGKSLSGFRKTDIHWKLKHRSDCSLLFGFWNITKWTREVTTGTPHSCSARSEVPVTRCVDGCVIAIESNEQLLN